MLYEFLKTVPKFLGHFQKMLSTLFNSQPSWFFFGLLQNSPLQGIGGSHAYLKSVLPRIRRITIQILLIHDQNSFAIHSKRGRRHLVNVDGLGLVRTLHKFQIFKSHRGSSRGPRKRFPSTMQLKFLSVREQYPITLLGSYMHLRDQLWDEVNFCAAFVPMAGNKSVAGGEQRQILKYRQRD